MLWTIAAVNKKSRCKMWWKQVGTSRFAPFRQGYLAGDVAIPHRSCRIRGCEKGWGQEGV